MYWNTAVCTELPQCVLDLLQYVLNSRALVQCVLDLKVIQCVAIVSRNYHKVSLQISPHALIRNGLGLGKEEGNSCL